MNLQEIVKLAFSKHTPNQPYLLAMSAGIDSTALFHILLELGINFSVAHANFGLRGTDSENDETFVKTLCSKNNIPFYSKTMDVLKFKKENNDSTQSAARKLRYQWFYELLDQHKLSQIITAHHLNDSAETFFINLLRGTGINGLTGIENQVKIFRPFLNVTSNQIKEYVEKQNITWREDYTNTEETYVRNKIRHNIIPTLEKIQPHFLANFHKTIQFLQDDIAIIQQSVAALRKRIFIIEDDFTQISVAELNQIQNDNLIYYLF